VQAADCSATKRPYCASEPAPANLDEADTFTWLLHEGAMMADYTVFLLNGNGRIYASSQLAAADDAAALEAAQNIIAKGQVAEVWSFSRMIGTVCNAG
jgi:hypothetical protein